MDISQNVVIVDILEEYDGNEENVVVVGEQVIEVLNFMSQGCTEPVPVDAVLDIGRREVVDDIVVVGHDGVHKVLVTDEEEPADLKDELMTNVVVVEFPEGFVTARCDTYVDAVGQTFSQGYFFRDNIFSCGGCKILLVGVKMLKEVPFTLPSCI